MVFFYLHLISIYIDRHIIPKTMKYVGNLYIIYKIMESYVFAILAYTFGN